MTDKATKIDPYRMHVGREPVSTPVPLLFAHRDTPRRSGGSVPAWFLVSGFTVTPDEDDDGPDWSASGGPSVEGTSLVCYVHKPNGKRIAYTVPVQSFVRACLRDALKADPEVNGLELSREFPLDHTAEESVDLLREIVEGVSAPAHQLIEAIDNARNWLAARGSGPPKPDGWLLYQATFRAGPEWFRNSLFDRDAVQLGRTIAKCFGQITEDRGVAMHVGSWGAPNTVINCPNVEATAQLYVDPDKADELETTAQRFAASNDLEVVHVFCVDDPDDLPDLAAFLPPLTVEEPHSDDPETEPAQ